MVKRFVLPNGVRVLLVPQRGSVATTALVLVNAGSEHESKSINGISHFLEHLCFKGTKKRPRPIDVASAFDELGASYNAFTSEEWTGYYVKVQKRQFDAGLEVVADLYNNPVFDPHELEREKDVVVEEINMYEDLPPRRVQEFFVELLYGDQPAGRSIAGKKETVRKLTREQVVRYRKKHYTAVATVVVIAGAFNPLRVKKQVEAYFRGVPKGGPVRKPAVRESQKKPEILVHYKESDQTHVVLGVRAFDAFHKDRYTLGVLSSILGGGMGSRLFQRVREELGAAYYVKASPELASDHGYFTISSGVQHRKLSAVIRAVLEECTRLKRELVPKKELQRAKDSMAGNLLLGLETSDALATFYGGQEILRMKLRTPDGTMKKIRAVTADGIRTLARALFHDRKLNLAMVGPLKGKAPFQKLLAFGK